MILGLRTKLLLAFGFLALITIGNFGLLWMAETDAAEEQSLVFHTHQVIVESEVFLGHLRDAETGQRGFLLTGQAEYLEPYTIGITQAEAGFQTLKSLTSDNPVQQLRLDAIQEQMLDKLAELGETIRLAQQGLRDEAMAIVLSDEGKTVMDAIRGSLADFQGEERRLLELREAGFRADQSTMKMVFTGGALLLVLFIAAIAVMFQRYLVNPIIELTESSAKLAAGEDVGEIGGIASKDEIGQLVRAFHAMAGSIRETLADLVRAKEEAQENEHRLTEIIWGTNVGTWEWNLETGETRFNERWAEIVGCTLDELSPTTIDTWTSLVHPDDAKRSEELLELHFSGQNEHYECETRMRHKNGHWVWVLDRGTVVEWQEDGRPLRVSGTHADITEQKKVDRLKSEFVSTVSHELRTPLTSIKGSLGLIVSGALGTVPEKARGMVDVAHKNADRLIALVNDILDMEKLQSGKMEFDFQLVDLSDLLTEALEANNGLAQQHNVTFSLADFVSGVAVRGDGNRLTQVVANLLSNAAKFSPDDGIVEISLSSHDGVARISISDHGPGIPEEFRQRMFGRFVQADASDTRQKGGTGLGLNISKSIIEMHGGAIGFESEVDVGSTFYFDLPLLGASERTVTPIAAAHTVKDMAKEHDFRVLICEDEPDIANILSNMFEEAGLGADIAFDAGEALRMLSDTRYDALTVDILLPGKDGLSLIRELRGNERTRDLPIVVISAKATEAHQIEAKAPLGVIDWLDKPLDQDRLLEAIGSAVHGAASSKPHVLYVEDDKDLTAVVGSLLEDTVLLASVYTLDEARQRLRGERFDLVIVDIGLPDGSGLSLLDDIQQDGVSPVPVIIFSAQEVDATVTRKVDAALVKSRTTNEKLVETVRSLISERKAVAEAGGEGA